MIQLRGEQEKAGRRVVVLGTFDGVHRGHQELLRQGRMLADKTGASLRVCTFDRHPLEVLFPSRAPGLLTDPEEKAEKMAEFGAEELRILTFDRDMAGKTPEEFLEMLGRECRMEAVVAGWNYTFGRGGDGSADTLREAGRKRGYEALIVPSVKTEDGQVISSSAIRERLLTGRLREAGAMLGYDYTLRGEVVSGKHMGSRLGVPTANIRTPERKLLPERGVYICELECGEQVWPAVVNVGMQPTLPSGRETVEAHVLHGSPLLYGRRAEVRLLERIRGEIHFGSVEELQAQIGRDIVQAEAFFAKKDVEALPEKGK